MNYKKPEVKFVSLRNEKRIANGNCWSKEASNNGKTWYYDTEGLGYISFTLDQNCSGNGTIQNAEPHNYTDETKYLYEQGIKMLNDNLKGAFKEQFTSFDGIEDDPSKVS